MRAKPLTKSQRMRANLLRALDRVGFVLPGRSCAGTFPKVELERLVERGVLQTARDPRGYDWVVYVRRTDLAWTGYGPPR